MFYHLFEYLKGITDFPGIGLMQYISFRSILAGVTSLLITIFVGKKIINYLIRRQVGDSSRDLGLEGQLAKEGTPTMGGLIILLAILIPALLFGDLRNIYVILLIITTVWLGFIGFVDDYIKVFKKNKEGLQGRYKVFGQITLGVLVGVTILFNDGIVLREKTTIPAGDDNQTSVTSYDAPQKSTKTTIPFVKENEFDYAWLTPLKGKAGEISKWIIYIIIIIFIVTAVSNSTNLTDGLDGLATGSSAIVGTTLGILAYLSGNIIYADYLNIMYIPNTGEIVIFMAAFIGALIGFLWYNSYPAQVFMGDTGSLAIGGIIAVVAILIRKELLLPILCGIFFVESLSVIIQRFYFKYTKKRYGKGVRVFRMTPLHHHYQKGNEEAIIQKPHNLMPEAKIVTRFWIIGLLLAVITVVTLKIR